MAPKPMKNEPFSAEAALSLTKIPWKISTTTKQNEPLSAETALP